MVITYVDASLMSLRIRLEDACYYLEVNSKYEWWFEKMNAGIYLLFTK